VRGLLRGPEEAIRGQTSALLGEAGPLWTRRLSLGADEPGVCGELERTLSAFGAARMVVGHTPQEDGMVHHRCGGRLILADTMISEAFTGVSHPSAVEFGPEGTATALYPGSGGLQRVDLPTPPPISAQA